MVSLGNIKQHLDVARQSANEHKEDVKKTSFTDDELDFMPSYLEVVERPPAKGGRRIMLGIVVFSVLVLIWSIWGRLDIIASATGQVIISGRSKVVQANEQGIIRAILVKDGVEVKKGDTLIELNPIMAKADVTRLLNQSHFAELEIARLRALLEDDPEAAFIAPAGIDQNQVSQVKAYLQTDVRLNVSRESTYQAKLTENIERQKALKLVKQETTSILRNIDHRLEGYRRLATKNYLSKVEVQELENRRLEILRQLAENRAESLVLDAQRLTLMSEYKQQRSEYLKGITDQLREKEQEILALGQEVIKAQERSRLQRIVSPTSGVVQQLAVNTQGAYVNGGEKLMVIVPDSRMMEAEVKIPNKDIGFVKRGQEVEVKIDSFPYTKYGTIPGKVRFISNDAVIDEKLGPLYIARVTLEKMAFTTSKESTPLTPGMSLTAEIKTGRRKIIDYLLSPLQEYQSESLKER